MDNDLLGIGSESIVRLCTNKKNGKNYAVKIYTNCDDEKIIMKKKQFKLLKCLNHKNIISAKYLFINLKTESI